MSSETDNECYECGDYDNNLCYVQHPTCEGCKYNEPNQLAHMDVGGCLYCPSEDESLIEADKFGQKTDSESEDNEDNNDSNIDTDNKTNDSTKSSISKPIKRKISEILDDNSETNIIKKFR